MNVIVTNAKNRIAYNVTRSLGGRGIKVFTADFVPRAMSFYSKYSSGNFLYPSPFRDQDDFIDCLIAKIKELEVEVLVPVYEELFLVAKYKQELLKHVKMAVPDYTQILVAHNKDKWAPLAQDLGIPVPVSINLKELIANADRATELTFPVLVKPKQGGGGWGIKELESSTELKGLIDSGTHAEKPLERFFVQEKIRGDVHCVGMFFADGVLKGKVGYRQVREYPQFGGQATCRVSVSNPRAEDHLQKLLERLEWHGVCQADFVVDSRTNVPYLIDINPRFWGSVAQGIASGVDFPYLTYQAALNETIRPIVDFKENVVTRWLGGELCGVGQHLKKSNSKLGFLREFVFSKNKTVLYDDFSLKDPFPFFAWGFDSLYRMMRYKNNKPHDALSGIWE